MKHYEPSPHYPAFAADYGTAGLRAVKGRKWHSMIGSTVIEHRTDGSISWLHYLDLEGQELISLSWLSLLVNPDSKEHPGELVDFPRIGNVIEIVEE